MLGLAGRTVELAGAEFLVLCANTMHKSVPTIEKSGNDSLSPYSRRCCPSLRTISIFGIFSSVVRDVCVSQDC